MSIAFREKLQLPANVVDELMSKTRSDIRQVINLLSVWRLSNAAIDYDEAKELATAGSKNFTLNIFDVVGKLLPIGGYRSSSLMDKIDYYFADFSMIPLMIQENYLRVRPRPMEKKCRDGSRREMLVLEQLSEAADSISDSDVMDKLIHGSQQWSLLPAHAILSCVIPSFYMHGAMGGMFAFPSWLGQNSKSSKYARLLQELQIKMRMKASADKNDLRQTYLPSLYSRLTGPLCSASGIPEVIELMDAYYLNREEFDTILELMLPSGVESAAPKTSIPSSVKSAFTRMYNKTSHPMVLPASSKVGASPPKEVAPDLEEVAMGDPEVVMDEEGGSSGKELAEDELGARKLMGSDMVSGSGNAKGNAKKRRTTTSAGDRKKSRSSGRKK